MNIGREDDELRLAVLNFIVVFIHNSLMQNNIHLSNSSLLLVITVNFLVIEI